MPSTFGQYEILATLGEGGMGTVYKARQRSLDRVVALKVLRPDAASPEAFARFEREARVLARLRHPNIVRLLTMGRDEDRVYFTMDFIDGRPLSTLIAEAHAPDFPLPPGERVRVRGEAAEHEEASPSPRPLPERERGERRDALIRHLAVVARAVHYAHTQGIIHRDLKPSNIIVDADGNPMITDFGLAKQLDAGQTVTAPGAAVGTALYMSPEQAEGDRDKIGPTTDVYALGAILYEILTGRPPFEAETVAAILEQTVHQDPIPPRRVERSVSRDPETICLKCLAKSPGDRYPTADGVAIDLEQYLAGRPIFAPRPLFPRLRRTLRAHPWQSALVGTTGLLLIALCFFALTRRRTPGLPEEEIARSATATQRALTQAEIERHIRELDAERRAEEEQRRQNEARRKAELEALIKKRLGEAEAARKRAVVPLAEAEAVITSYYRVAGLTCIAASEHEAWWGTAGGAVRMDPESGERLFYPTKRPVTSIAQDREEVWWFGTEGAGVLRFDGRAWRTYTAKDGLPGGPISGVAVDQKNRKWFLGLGQVCCFDGETWKSYRVVGHGRAIAAGPDGRIWFGKDRVGIACYDGTAWKTYPAEQSRPGGPPKLGPLQVLPRNGKKIGVRSLLSPEEAARQRREADQETIRMDLASESVTAIAVDRHGRPWVGGISGVYSFDGTTWKMYRREHGLAGNVVTAMAIDKDDRKWLGTDGGLSCYDGRAWKTYTAENGLVDDDVRAVSVDPRGRIWVGTAQAVSCFDGKTWKSHRTRSGLAGNRIVAIAVDAAGRKWFSVGDSPRGGLCSFDGEVWKTYAEKDGLVDTFVTAIATDKEGRVWFGMSDGIRCFDGAEWKAYRVRDGLARVRRGRRRAGPEDLPVRAIAVAPDGRLWIGTGSGTGTGNGAACCFDGKSWMIFTTKDGLVPGTVSALAIDGAGRKWFGASPCWDGSQPEVEVGGGVSCFDGEAWTTYTAQHGLASNSVNAIAIDRQGRTWVGTGDGVSCFDGGTWKTYTRKDGFVGKCVYAIAIDAQGRPWFGTAGGVSCFDGTTWRTWTTNDYLAGNNVTSLAVDFDGSIWVGTTTGVSHIVLKRKE